MKKSNLISKLGRKAFSLATVIGIPLAINQAGYSYIQPKWCADFTSSYSEKKEFDIPGLEEMAPHLDARDFLNLANDLVHEDASPSDVCRHYAVKTRDRFLGLIDKVGKSNLADCVDLESDGTHFWITINEGGQSVPYETMHKTGNITPYNVKEYSEDTEVQRTYLNGRPQRNANSVCRGRSKEFVPTYHILTNPIDAVNFLRINLGGMK